MRISIVDAYIDNWTERAETVQETAKNNAQEFAKPAAAAASNYGQDYTFYYNQEFSKALDQYDSADRTAVEIAMSADFVRHSMDWFSGQGSEGEGFWETNPDEETFDQIYAAYTGASISRTDA